jgi:hypothetical protein
MGKCFRIASCHNHSVCPESSDFMHALHRVGRFEVDEVDSTESEDKVAFIASVDSDNQRTVGSCVLNYAVSASCYGCGSREHSYPRDVRGHLQHPRQRANSRL